MLGASSAFLSMPAAPPPPVHHVQPGPALSEEEFLSTQVLQYCATIDPMADAQELHERSLTLRASLHATPGADAVLQLNRMPVRHLCSSMFWGLLIPFARAAMGGAISDVQWPRLQPARAAEVADALQVFAHHACDGWLAQKALAIRPGPEATLEAVRNWSPDDEPPGEIVDRQRIWRYPAVGPVQLTLLEHEDAAHLPSNVVRWQVQAGAFVPTAVPRSM